MTKLGALEEKLNELLVTNAPVQLPENWRKWLAQYAWIFALVGFVLGLFSVLALLSVVGLVSAIGAAAGAGGALVFAWISLAVLVAYVVLLGIAIPKLKRFDKSGWDLIFYSSLFFLVYDIFNWLREVRFGSLFGLIWNVLWSVIGLYFVFQMRGYFVSGKAVNKKVATKSVKKTPKATKK